MYQQKQKELLKQYEKQEKKLKDLKAGGKSTKQAVSLWFGPWHGSSKNIAWLDSILALELPTSMGTQRQSLYLELTCGTPASGITLACLLRHMIPPQNTSSQLLWALWN